MPDHHGPPAGDGAGPHDDEHPAMTTAYAGVGLRLFAVYLAFYAGFVGLNAFAPRLMARAPLGGLNLALAYGLGLIAGAVVLALLYMALCRRIARRHRAEGGR